SRAGNFAAGSAVRRGGAAVPGDSGHRARSERTAVGAVVRGRYGGRSGELRRAGDKWRRREDVVGAEAGDRSAVVCASFRSVLVARAGGGPCVVLGAGVG